MMLDSIAGKQKTVKAMKTKKAIKADQAMKMKKPAAEEPKRLARASK